MAFANLVRVRCLFVSGALCADGLDYVCACSHGKEFEKRDILFVPAHL